MIRMGGWLVALVGVLPGGLWSPLARAQGKTLGVPGEYPTLQQAIDAAATGDTVLVEAGTYRERVRLKAGVVLRSAGEDKPGKLGLARAETTVIDGGGKAEGGPGVLMGEGSVLDGFTVTGIAKFDQAEYDKHYATQGENLPDERGAVASPDHPFGVFLPGVTAVVRNNIVHDNGDVGIGCFGEAGGRNGSWISANVVYRNMGGGIGIADGATPLVEKNRCYNNLRGGIGSRKSAGLIVGNECFDNVRAGIGIREGATPMVRGNKCHKNRRAGIGIRMEGTAPVVEDNDCYGNAMAGIGCRNDASPLIRGNRCFENALAGIGVQDGAHPVVFGNKCHHNKDAGIGLQTGARAHVGHNECYENEKAGISHRGNVETTLGGNHVHHNKASGLGFEESKEGRSTVLNNKVLDNGAVAVGIHAGWKVRLSGNELSTKGGMEPVVMVYKGAEADFSDNVIRGDGVAGIRTAGVVRAIHNTFESPELRKVGPPSNAIWALASSDVVFLDNSVSGWRHALSAEKASVIACHNKVSRFGQTGLRIDQPPAPVTVVGNRFEGDPSQAAVTLTGGGGIVEDNRVEPPK
jgi:hypothetical protein